MASDRRRRSPRRSPAWSRLLALGLLAAGGAPAAAQATLPEALDFSNSTDVGVEPEVARLAFYRAEEHLTAGREKAAGEEIVRLLRSPTSGRVRVGERLVVPLETAALLLLARLPAAVRDELARADAAVT
ncbi:MAG: hypothetical protein FJ293_05495, partial [Planctomycetes bacterium]|nr:hypothetical protein [Planctomycetota bacterium]